MLVESGYSFCPKCGHAVGDAAGYCLHCNYCLFLECCNECAEELPARANFCTCCGVRTPKFRSIEKASFSFSMNLEQVRWLDRYAEKHDLSKAHIVEEIIRKGLDRYADSEFFPEVEAGRRQTRTYWIAKEVVDAFRDVAPRQRGAAIARAFVEDYREEKEKA